MKIVSAGGRVNASYGRGTDGALRSGVKPAAVLIVLVALGGGCFRDAYLEAFPGRAHPVLRGSPLQEEISAGYGTYKRALAGLGQWRPDDGYGFEWCPTTVDPRAFAPYRSRGHWTAGEDAVQTPSWHVDDGSEWGEITMHHGWWVYDDWHELDALGTRWCWVPGVESTPARVVWRTGDGFVGWAPEPPPTDPDDEEDDDTLDWTFEFAGTLLEDTLELFVLTGESAIDVAAAATHHRAEDGTPGHPRRAGPTRGEVAGARRALADYTLAHPEAGRPGGRVPAAPVVGPPAERPPQRLPPAMSLYDHLSHTTGSGVASGPERGTGLPRVGGGAFHGSFAGVGGGGGGGAARGSTLSSPGFGGHESHGSSPSGGGSSFGHSSFGHGSSSSSSSHSGRSDGGCGGGGHANSPSHGGRR